MKKQKELIYTLTESQLIKLVKKVISEQSFLGTKSINLYLDQNMTKRHRLDNELHVIVNEIQTVESRDHDLVVWMYYGSLVSTAGENTYKVAFKWRCQEGDFRFKELDGSDRDRLREFISSFYNIPNPTTTTPPNITFYNQVLRDWLRKRYCVKNRSDLWVPAKDFAQSGTSKTDNDNIA
jgi:hypothetical protein